MSTDDRLAAARAALEQAERLATGAAASSPPERRPGGCDPDGGHRGCREDGTRADEPDPHDVARQIVLRQLAMAPRSRAQLEDRLRSRRCPDEIAAAVLDRMEEVGLVDDEAYAQMLVRSQVATRGLARRGLAHELRRKGVEPQTAAAALDELDPDDERRNARALVDKRLRTMAGLDVEVQTRRLAAMLGRKGYPAGLAYAVIRDAMADAPEHQRD